jgi:hypothetical protein
MPDPATTLSKSAYLAAAWPHATEAIKQTYLSKLTWTVLDGAAGNLVGYWLWALQRFEGRVHDLYPDEQYPRAALDLAAAREVRYHWQRRRQFIHPVAALAKCLWNLAGERPDRLAEARQQLARIAPSPARHKHTPPQSVGDVIREVFAGDP